MSKRRSEVILAVLASLLVGYFLFPRGPGGNTSLDIKSAKGEYVGQGREWHLTPLNITAGYAYGKAENGVVLNLRTKEGDYVSLWFSAPGKQPLQIGSYENATRNCVHKADEAGLDVYGWGRGYNKLQGKFEILDIANGPQGPTRFAANFMEYGDGKPSQCCLEGSVRYQSLIP
jgi:hypothetical protein